MLMGCVVFVEFVNASFMAASSILSFSLPKPNLTKAAASLSIAPTSTSLPDTLDQKFGRKGIKFYVSGDVPLVELTVRNGSSLKLQIPNAHVTSYRPKVYWKDDGFEEVLYTLPPPAAAAADGKSSSTNSKGGIGLVINDVSDPNSKGSLIKTSEWTVKDVDSDSIDAVQVLYSDSQMFSTLSTTHQCSCAQPVQLHQD